MEAHEPVIALLLFQNGLADNAYSIIRHLERRFGWLHWGEIKQYLLAHGYLVQLDQSQVPAYAITLAGEAFSARFREQALAKVQKDPFTHTEHTRWLINRL
jgi:hypothetical protein